MLIDTHCHLDFEQFDEDRESVIQRAIKNNIGGIITIGTDIPSSRKSLTLAANYATIYAAVGIHPSDCAEADERDLEEIRALCATDKVVAIGEIGLDYYRMYAPKEKQQEIFRAQLALAAEKDLPVIIHNREAHEDTISIVEEAGNGLRGVFHSFTGDSAFLKRVLNQNFYVSFTGAVTFKNAHYEDLIKEVPVDNLLLETDSPFLAPVPFRGKRNEPSYVRYTAEHIAGIKEMPVEVLAEITSKNANDLFNLMSE